MIFNVLGSLFAAVLWICLTLFVAIHEAVLAFDILDVANAYFVGSIPLFVGFLLVADIFIDHAIVGSRKSILQRKPRLALGVVLFCILLYAMATLTFSAELASSNEDLKRFCCGSALFALFLVRFLSYLKIANPSSVAKNHVAE